MQEQMNPPLTLVPETLAYADTGAFSALILDYLQEKPALKPYYNRYPRVENFEAQISERTGQPVDRELLVSTLRGQYKNSGIKRPPETLELLLQENTFTVTTGHQLVLFSGPVYFLYKIITTIKTCRELAERYPDRQFVPVFWLASEDHDLEEANHFFTSEDCKITWHTEQTGAVGRMTTETLQPVLHQLEKEFGIGYQAADLSRLFKSCYLQSADMASATRKLVHELFGPYGVVVVDGDDKAFKSQAITLFQKELQSDAFFQAIQKTSEELAPDYKIQVHPREINLFYLDSGLRERIVKEDGRYYVLNTELQFSERELQKLLESQPEKFSPNVVLRPVYQELILPNLAYVGGGGELAYWLQLKEAFAKYQVVFPMLMLRNSALILPEKISRKIEKLNLSLPQLFAKREKLRTELVQRNVQEDLELKLEKEELKKVFAGVAKRLSEVDPLLGKSAASAETRSLHLLENLEKKWLRAEKRRHQHLLDEVDQILSFIRPGGSLQERRLNFSVFWCRYGRDFSDALLNGLEPFDYRFTVFTEK